ncbi:MAG TPA: SDR family NAD(P)-dependent oxidoreductase, partial [Dehalococcoidales bacterium]|nr:SDR family NAD(P)-dependent oxidoreductase [Dehalococcoidales bacterium]
KLKTGGADVLAVVTDVSSIDEVEALSRRTLALYGGVHLLFNNAGVQARNSIHYPVWENTPADWEWLLGINVWGLIYGIQTFVPVMLEQNTECHIVNTSSTAGLIAEPQLVIYSATKAAIIKISEGLYLQLQERKAKIGVSVLCPAFVSSRLGDAERNRPQHLQNEDRTPLSSEPPALVRRSRAAKLNVLSPEQSAEIVFQAIRERRFYIFTDELVTRLFTQMAENIQGGRNPEVPQF